MTIREDEMVEQLDRLLAGWSGENELSVGPHMLAQGLHEAREHITALSSERDLLREALTKIAEGNIGDEPWQANYDRIRKVARAALDTGVTGE